MKWIHADKAIIGDGSTVVSPVWLQIAGDRIRTITATKPELSDQTEIIELKNMTLTPGLFNLHDHISRKALREPSDISFSQRSKTLMAEDASYLLLHSVKNAHAALREGITWLRDYGLAGYTTIHLKRAIAEGLVSGPQLSVCGQPICQSGGHTWRQAHQADGPDAVRAAVREEIRAGADVIKFMASGGLEHFPAEDPQYPQFTEEELRAGIAAAHDQGLSTAAHIYATEGILRAVRAGLDSVEHGCLMNEKCIELMVKQGTALVPTLTGLRGVASRGPLLRYQRELQERIYQPQENGLRMALAAGIPIGTGTDSAGKLAEEIRLLAAVLNETPVAALAHATGIAAEIARCYEVGLLKEGWRANIVAFKGDLTLSLDGLEAVAQVWKDGQEVI